MNRPDRSSRRPTARAIRRLLAELRDDHLRLRRAILTGTASPASPMLAPVPARSVRIDRLPPRR